MLRRLLLRAAAAAFAAAVGNGPLAPLLYLVPTTLTQVRAVLSAARAWLARRRPHAAAR